MAPKLYIMQVSPPCRAVMMVAKAIGLELDIEEVEREALKTPEMLELNPQHTVPILVDEDFVVWDSHAIAGYLVGQYAEDDTLYPKGDIRKRAIIDQRLHFENGVLYERCRAVAHILFSGIGDISEDDRDKLLEAYGFLEEFLNGHPWLAGDEMTVADLSVLATLASADLFIPVEADRFPQLFDWLKTGKELPFFDECNAEGLAKFKEMLPTPES
ncbi:glutathione S-transferase 1-like [Tribolium madens]|uniref:glutathione S-transferase 1-like n=1 Tax=Tribolium madens TaxID=41895 RepID=UPI001CF732BF|nr:glutathione S-transferase 1-like [Tribolium madens]